MILPINEIEITAKSLEEAIEQATQQLSVDTSQIQIDVVEESKKLFGRGHVRIKAKIINFETEEKSPKPESTPKKKTKKEKPIDVNKNNIQKAANLPAEMPQMGIDIDIDANSETLNEKEVTANENDATQYLLLLREILKLADIRVKAQLKNLSGRYVYLSLEGEDIGLLLTRRAETLNSLQYLLNVIVFRKTLRSTRVSLDAGDYRQKREDSLCRLAQQVAKEVILRGEEAILDPLPAFERKIIHHHLQNIEGIRTYSEGDEPNRYVVIAPAE